MIAKILTDLTLNHSREIEVCTVCEEAELLEFEPCDHKPIKLTLTRFDHGVGIECSQDHCTFGVVVDGDYNAIIALMDHVQTHLVQFEELESMWAGL